MILNELDKMIVLAMRRLNESDRGRRALLDLRNMMDNGASGLDLENTSALCILVIAALNEGKREFLSLIV